MSSPTNPNIDLLSAWYRELEQSLRRSRSFCIALFTARGELLFANPAMTSLLGSSPLESFVNPLFETLVGDTETPPTDKPVFRGFMTFQGSDGEVSILADVYRRDAQLFILGEIDVTSLAGQYLSMVELNRENTLLQRDLLKQKRALQQEVKIRTVSQARVQALLEEKEMILREVHHRIKNNMSTVSSLLRLQSSLHDDVRVTTALDDALQRVQSMMLLYEKLYQSEDVNLMALDEYVVPLMKNAIGVFPNGQRITLHTEIVPIKLNPKLLSELGIILNELITNAMKHAFRTGEAGEIALIASWRDKKLTLEFSDNGCGLPGTLTPETSSGFGMQVITLLVQQLSGSLTVERSHGTRFIFQFPLEDNRAVSEAPDTDRLYET